MLSGISIINTGYLDNINDYHLKLKRHYMSIKSQLAYREIQIIIMLAFKPWIVWGLFKSFFQFAVLTCFSATLQLVFLHDI